MGAGDFGHSWLRSSAYTMNCSFQFHFFFRSEATKTSYCALFSIFFSNAETKSISFSILTKYCTKEALCRLLCTVKPKGKVVVHFFGRKIQNFCRILFLETFLFFCEIGGVKNLTVEKIIFLAYET